MDFHSLPRRDLQTLCKRNKIPANMTNVAMADALQALPMAEGLGAIIQDAQQYQSPKRAAAAGSPDPPSRSCWRTSTRRLPNPPGSSLPRTRRGAAGRASKNEAAMEKEDGSEEDAGFVPTVGIPNSPATLNNRGQRTRTLITTSGLEGEEEEEVEAEKKGEGEAEPLHLEVPKTPATRATRGRRVTTQIAKPSTGADEVAKKQEEGGAPAVPQTPAASTARRASTRRRTRAAPAPEEASGARSTRYRTRQSSSRASMEEVAELEAAIRISTTTASRKKGRRAKGVVFSPPFFTGTSSPSPPFSLTSSCPMAAADAGVIARDVFIAGEDGAEGRAPAESAEEELEMVVVVGFAGGAPAEAGGSVDPTAENCLALPEVEGSDGPCIDQTVEKAAAGGVLVKEKLSDGVDQTVEEERFGATYSVDPTVDLEGVLMVESVDRTVANALHGDVFTPDKSDWPVDQTVVEGKFVDGVDDHGEVKINPTVMASPLAVHQMVEDGPSGEPLDLLGEVEDAPAEGMVVVAVEMEGSLEGRIDRTVVEEEVPEIVEASLNPTVDEEEVPVVHSDDQTVEEVSEPVDSRSDETLVPVEVEGHVDPTAQEIEVPILDSDAEFEEPPEEPIDPTVVDDGDLTASEGGEGEPKEQMETPIMGVGVEVFPVESSPAAEETPEIENPNAGIPALVVQVAVIAAAASETLLPATTSEAPAMDVQVLLQTEEEEHDCSSPAEKKNPPVKGREEEEEVAEKEEKAPGLISNDDPLAEREEEEESEKEERAPGSIDEPPAGEEKAVNLVHSQQPLMPVPGADLFFLGDQDKENAAVEACLSNFTGGGALKQGKQQQMTVIEYDSTTSMRKLKAAVKKMLQLQAMEARRNERAALAALDDNCCIMSPKQC